MDHTILRTYQEQLQCFEVMRQQAITFITDVLETGGIKIHHVTGRVKKPASLREKLQRRPGRYQSISEITDIVAVRVITYFESDVWQVSKVLEQELIVDWDHSVDKSKMHDPDRFGYMGVHYVVRFPPQVTALEGFAPFDGLWFEVQIRSILQHAWAEIEHDLGYKSKASVPRDIKRRFYRLAGLLEIADEEFMAIHRLTQNYAQTLPERIDHEPDSVFLDAQSVEQVMALEPIKNLDERIAGALGVRVGQFELDGERVERITAALKYVRVTSVGQLIKELQRRAEELVSFAATLMPLVPTAWSAEHGLRPGVTLVQYVLWRAGRDENVDVAEVVRLLDLRAQAGGPERLAQLVQLLFGRNDPGSESGPNFQID